MLYLEQSFVCCWHMDTSESRSELPVNTWNVVLEKDVDQLCRSYEEKLRRITYTKGGNEYPTYNKKKEG
jgi:hypothetical protein